MAKAINTDQFSAVLREKSIDLNNRRLLITRIRGSEQEADLTEPPNCNGVGRIRHFRRQTSLGWPSNPLPIDPACRRLELPRNDSLRAQVFQNAACNWRCWYCYVPFSLLNADPKQSEWRSASELIELYLEEPNRPRMIDLTGGQPDLVPEWIPWMMRELQERGLSDEVYLWSDDNLSNDYFWQYLTDADVELVRNYVNYGKVCCFKGFSDQSFAFKTGASVECFDRQFSLFERYLGLGIDLYGYVTLTTPTVENIQVDMGRFIDRLQGIDETLPLRIVPLEVRAFSPVASRMTPTHDLAIRNQQVAVECWRNQLSNRFLVSELAADIYDVEVQRKGACDDPVIR